jgi:hypothetical protein
VLGLVARGSHGAVHEAYVARLCFLAMRGLVCGAFPVCAGVMYKCVLGRWSVAAVGVPTVGLCLRCVMSVCTALFVCMNIVGGAATT